MTSKILCPVDGTDHAVVALIVAVAADIAAKFEAELPVCVVNVLYGRSPRDPHVSTWTKDEADKNLADAVTLVTARGQTLAHANVISEREASTGIIHHAATLDIDHIVIGTGDKTAWNGLCLDRWQRRSRLGHPAP